MTEETQPAEQGAAAEEQQQFGVQRIYLKDFSFEAPLGATAFIKQIKPNIDQELATESQKVADDIYEVTLKITVTAKTEDATAFLVEVHQAGLFFIKGVEGKDFARVLNANCPQLLFPYAREAIDSVLLKGSFPPVMLPPINFDALFLQALAEKKADSTH